MATFFSRRFGFVWIACMVLAGATPAQADEIWVAPTSQADIGGLGVATNVFWPVTPIGAVRLAWSIPDDLQTFQSAKVAIIPGAPAGGPPALHFYVCAAQNGTVVSSDCTGPFVHTFTNAPNQLTEVEIGGVLSAHIGTAGLNYLAILAYTTPATTTDHVVGLRFSYAPKIPTGVATLSTNTFTGSQTAPAFVGDGSGLTNLPIPSGAATLGANTFIGTQTAPAFVGNGAGLTSLPFPTGAATLGANVFSGTQTISAGHLDLGTSTATSGVLTHNGVPFLHNFGNALNTFVGDSAGNFTMTGGNNTGIGRAALTSDTNGFSNTAIGLNAMFANTSGSLNVAAGWSALSSNSTGIENTAVGFRALVANNAGSNNLAAGGDALFHTLSGSNNVAVGFSAGFNATTGSNNIYLGANVVGVGGESNSMYLGLQGTQAKTVIAGIRGITTSNADAIPVVIDSSGQLGTISSSFRFKEDIHDMADASQRLFNLRPVTFRYTTSYANGSKPIQFGLVAEEVADVFPELAVRDAQGNVETVHYETLNVLLLNEVQRQQRELARERTLREDQQQRIDVLEQRLNARLGVAPISEHALID